MAPARRRVTGLPARLTAGVVGIGVACAFLTLVVHADQSVVGTQTQQGLLPTNSTQQSEVLEGQSYTYVSEYLFGNHSWLNYSYRGVTFEFRIWCWITVDVGYLCGNVIEHGGALFEFNFTDGLPTQNPPWQDSIAPDHGAAVQYQDGGNARLCVAS